MIMLYKSIIVNLWYFSSISFLLHYCLGKSHSVYIFKFCSYRILTDCRHCISPIRVFRIYLSKLCECTFWGKSPSWFTSKLCCYITYHSQKSISWIFEYCMVLIIDSISNISNLYVSRIIIPIWSSISTSRSNCKSLPSVIER